jgi:hypothetical protein
MRYGFHGVLSAIIAVAASGLLAAAQAGEFKTLNTNTLAAGGSVTAVTTPKDPIPLTAFGGAIEMESFEFQTSPAGGSYHCQIVANNTNKTLNISLIGVNATVINSCSAAAGGTCNTPAVGLVGDLKFQCLLATQCCNAAATTGNATIGVHH